MPRIRLLFDSITPATSDGSSVDAQGNLVFDVGMGDTVRVVIDASGYANNSTISTSTWTSPDGLTLSGAALTTPVASVLAAIPTTGAYPWQGGFRLINVLTTSDTRVRRTMIWLRGQGRGA